MNGIRISNTTYMMKEGNSWKVTSLMLREVPMEERPRERMLQYGAGALSHAELLAILLRTGTVSESALRLAGRILSESGGLAQPC